MPKFFIKISLLLLILLPAIKITGVPATPYPVTRIQPDGSELTVYLKGDEFFRYEVTLDGYLIKKDKKGFYNYAQQIQQGKITSTGIRANQIEHRTLIEKNLLKTISTNPDLSSINRERRSARMKTAGEDVVIQKIYPRTGSPKSLVILVNFKDVSFVTPNPKTAFTNLLNQENYSTNGATGSAREYFKDASNGNSSPEFVVVGPFTLPNNRAYYGANDTTNNDEDIRPRNMVIDACRIADTEGGVDFSQFDTDRDSIVDNVFIYYAGHNEAEGGPEESVWPHRWVLSPSTNLKIDKKKVDGYACTSELRGSRDNNMCGIGTFCHEFGHVYGLPDYYITNSSVKTEHHTLSSWNIMDSGAYLNQGRTPPTYSAYDRFYLGWLTPTILNSPDDITLNDLLTSNQAYLITQSGTHNLNGSNPSPLEFFTLENRQKKKWDASLPRSGMLITRIYYNQSDWYNNTPNNNPLAMGVDIMEADGTASETLVSMQGDPFPGSKNVTIYSPKLRSGVDISRPLTRIKETNGIITFKFMGGKNPPVVNSNHNTITPFSTIQGTPSTIQEFTVSGINIPEKLILDFNIKSHFEIKRKDDLSNQWVKTLTLATIDSILDSTTILVRYNPTEPSYKDIHTEYLNFIIEEVVMNQFTLTGTSSRPVLVVPPVATAASAVSLNGFTANWTDVFDATGYYLTVYSTSEGSSELTEGFDNGLTPPVGWTINATSVFTQSNYSGATVPSIQLANTGDSILTELFDFPVTAFSFYVHSIGEISGKIKVEANNGSEWILLDNFDVISTLNTTKSYILPEVSTYRQFRIIYKKGIASVAIDDVTVKFALQVDYNARNKWVTDTSAPISLILPGKKYHYFVKASDKTYYPDSTAIMFENITAPSNLMDVVLADENIVRFSGKNDPEVAVYKDLNGFVVLDLSKAENEDPVYLYTSDGKLIKTIKPDNKLVSLSNLLKGQFYILRVGKTVIKFIL
ncbi:MAG: M6 family metalloprotease domain-containing protein [Paludibacter sp.]|nr:M6 family metalloprotease domain-containing protein [Paludibacter sp.]